MSLTDIFRRAGRSLRNAKGRTILTSLAIAVGAFTLTAALAAGTGARQYANKLIQSNVDPQSVFVAKDKSMFGGDAGQNGLRDYSENETDFAGAKFEALTSGDIEKIRATKNVDSVMVTYIVRAKYLTFEGNEKKFTTDITAYDPTVRAEVAAGDLPPLREQLRPEDVVVPESFLEKLGLKKPSDLVGKKVTLHLEQPAKKPTDAQIQEAYLNGGFDAVKELTTGNTLDVKLTVRAVSAKSSTAFSASNGLFIAYDKARELSDFLTKDTDQYQKYLNASIRVRDGVDPATVKSALEEKGLVARTANDLQNLLFTIVNVIQSIVMVFGVLALIASVFGIINTQYISVLERTREIGLMKALGMRGRHVSLLFQFEAAWIGLLGGIAGSLLAIGVGIALNPWLSKLMSIGENRILVFEPIPIIMLVIALMFIAMIAGWFPARKAAKLDPIEALRTE